MVYAVYELNAIGTIYRAVQYFELCREAWAYATANYATSPGLNWVTVGLAGQRIYDYPIVIYCAQ